MWGDPTEVNVPSRMGGQPLFGRSSGVVPRVATVTAPPTPQVPKAKPSRKSHEGGS
jgi:hypothetical protein